MKKIASLLLTVALLATMLTALAVPASAADSRRVTLVYNCPPGKEIRCKPLTEYWFGSDTKLPVPAVTDNSFAFIGWYDNPGLSGSPVTKIPKGSTGDKTFYAKWGEVYEIRWHRNGGTLMHEGALISYIQDDPYKTTYTSGKGTEMYGMQKEGYGFAGWYDNPDFTGAPVTEVGANETGDKDFYARFCTKIDVPQANVNLVYNGQEQIGVSTKEGYTVKDNAKTYPGTYNAVATLVDGYIWADGTLADKTIPWSIGKSKVTVSYLERTVNNDNSVNTEENTRDDLWPVIEEDKAWGKANDDTWYVCLSDITINNRIDIIGNVHLIICDGCTLTAKNGIHLKEGNTLSIYAQSNGENQGKLVAYGNSGNAAIGGNCGANDFNVYQRGTPGESCGTLNVCGAAVIAEGNGTAGIGGGKGGNGLDGEAQNGGVAKDGITDYGLDGHDGGNGGTVNVYAGTVTAKGSVGIGGGNGGMGGKGSYYCSPYTNQYEPRNAGNSGKGGSGSNITVYGGTVNSSGDTLGIGGGKGGNGQVDSLDHSDYPFEGTGGDGGNGGDGGKLTVKGGTVQLHGKVKAAGGGEGGIPLGKSTSQRSPKKGNPGSDTTFDLENCVLKSGDSETNMGVVTEYDGEAYYFSVQYNGVSALGSILSFGYPWIIIAIAVLGLGAVVVLVIVKKKKKPVLADGENKDEE